MLFLPLLPLFFALTAGSHSLHVREDHRCGIDYGNSTCDPIFGRCCSKYGFCGKSLEHCLLENGCQSGCTLFIKNATLLIPWTWTVKPTPEEALRHPCPSVGSILTTFAVINIISGTLSTVFGHRIVVNKVSFGLFGKRGGNSWTYMWIMPLTIQLSANAIIASMIKRTPGYGNDFTVAQLMLFFAARPRISWILVMLLSDVKKRKVTGNQRDQGDKPLLEDLHTELMQIPRQDMENDVFDGIKEVSLLDRHAPLAPIKNVYEDDYYWRNAALSQYFAELALQAITLYYMGRTVVFASSHGYYSPGTLPGPIGHNANIMYAGALFWLCAQAFVYLTAPSFVFVLLKEGGGVQMVTKLMQMLGGFLVITSWLASWLFWAGFVRLAGDSYCPPKLFEQGTIWTVFSSLGVLTGVGL
ncbi:carbohydrate-binding module family 18 protein [Glonium stellatum]|uniref:Carbohydrate-binding module family 18 protein n=1 Tax=Glonium stellatum TaxID=574774 RepID=A0A8E2JYP7_9PEZI|nr:carbohydrate-binding module family 18 protein [Glonium stellatum]